MGQDRSAGNMAHTHHKGGSTLELLVAFAILVTALSATVLVAFSNQSVTVDLQTNTEAIYKAQALLEEARAAVRQDFGLLNPKTMTDPSGPLTYTQKLEVRQVDLFTKQATSSVSWQSGGRTLTVSFTSLFSNPQAVGGGETCSSILLGNWTAPQMTVYEFGADILSDSSSGFPITAIELFNHKLFVTVHNAHGNNADTFFVLNVTNPAVMPTVLGRLDNNPAITTAGLSDVAYDGTRYAYVANRYGANFATCTNTSNTNKSCAQLQVIDLNASPIAVVRSYKIAGVTGSGGQGVGMKVAYRNGIVYVGLSKTNGPEFAIFDVGGGGTPGASPTNAKLLAGVEIDAGVNDILLRGDYAYIASPDNQELKIFNIHTPSAPTAAGYFDAPGGGGNNGNGRSLYAVGNTLYFGRTLLSGGDEFYFLNNTNPSAALPSYGSANIVNGSTNSSVNGIIVRDALIFLITNEEFQIYHRDSLGAMSQYASPLTLPPGSGGGLNGSAADCEGNYIFVGSQSSNDKGYISVITGS